MTKSDVYKFIAQSSLYGNLGLFIGAGFSHAVNEEFPTCKPLNWSDLLKQLCKDNNILWEDKKDDDGNITEKSPIIKEFVSCPEIASQICKIISEKTSMSLTDSIRTFKHQICNITSWYADVQQRNQYHDLLIKVSPRWIVTTNYDLILETLLPEESISLSPKDELVYPKSKIPIYHLHGIRTDPDTIIITREDYIQLSRPHNYRMEKLSLMFSESSTLMIGYKIGDPNVQTALDWSKNIYDEQNSKTTKYPHKIIQLVHKRTPADEPYETENGIIILETDSVFTILKEISDTIDDVQIENDDIQNEVLNIQNKFLNPTEEDINNFITNDNVKNNTIKEIIKNPNIVIATENFLSVVFKTLWKKTEPYGAFDEYADILDLLLYIFKNFELKKFPPSIYMFFIEQFEALAPYINNTYYCDSAEACRHWRTNKDSIKEDNKIEIKNISQWNWQIKSLLKRFNFS